MNFNKSFILLISIIFLISLNLAFAADENATEISNTPNSTNEIVSEITNDFQTTNDNPTIKHDGVINRYRDNYITYQATFFDYEGNPLKNTDVGFSFDDDVGYYEPKTDSNGIALLTLSLAKGSHTIHLFNYVTGETSSDTLNVFDVVSGGKNIIMYYGDGNTYKVRVYDNDGNPVKAGQKVTFHIDTKTYIKTTDKNGYASIKLNSKPGYYYINAIYDTFEAINYVFVKNVLKPIYSFKSQAIKPTVKFKVKFLGKHKKNKVITVKFNKKTYKVKTNKKGIAKVTLKTPKKVGLYLTVIKYKKEKVTLQYTKFRI